MVMEKNKEFYFVVQLYQNPDDNLKIKGLNC